MKKFWLLSLLLTIGITTAALVPDTASGQKVKFRRSANGVPNRYIVALNPEYVESFAPAVESEAAYLSYVYGGKVKKTYANALRGFTVQMSERAAMALSRDDRVEMVEQDGYTYTEATQSSATWGIDRIDQQSLPLDTNYTYNTDASNVNAYIIDSGIRSTHVDFGGRATKDYDAVGDGQNGNDCNGHGTHVAGTVGSATYGVAKNVRLHAVRVLGCSGSGMISDLIEGVDWVRGNHVKPAVANISIIVSGGSSILDNAIQNAINAGVTMVVAAGNNNLDACNYSPARAVNAITVGATASNDTKAPYSNWGSCVDIWAPGTVIRSLSYANDLDSRILSGTSMAAPHVAGAAALYMASNPTASPATVTQNIVGNATLGKVIGLDGSSNNKLLYTLAADSPSPTPAPASVKIKKRANSRTESVSSAEFPYSATKLAAASFTLQPDNQFEDVNVTAFGSANTITVTESQVYGWKLSSISCVETSGGTPNAVNSTVDLANRKANIVVEPGEQVECTFTSEEIVPTAANATISGRVVSPDGRGVKNISITLLDVASGQTFNATTNSFGYYYFSDKPVSRLYSVTAANSKRQRIQDNVRTFSLTEDFYVWDFVTSR